MQDHRAIDAAPSALGEAIVAKNRALSTYLKAKGELDDANAALRHAENRFLREQPPHVRQQVGGADAGH